MTRYAAQRLLAERPPLTLTDKLARNINYATEMLLMRSGDPFYQGDTIARRVGLALPGADGRPVQMEMRVDDGFLGTVMDPEMYRQEGIGAISGERGTLDALEAANPQKVREISFGWRPAESEAGSGKLMYRDNVNTYGVDYKSKLQAAKESLLEQAGMEAGDLITAIPYGFADGDLRRARTYLRQGYGLPDASSGVMVGQLQSNGGLLPVQLYTPEATFMKRLGFKQA